ncbi:MAG: DUF3192 domain-containing protein [Xanthomonadales bacterium]|nr:DUF3192 domain-containing protein [Xanthomonadales bacterium]
MYKKISLLALVSSALLLGGCVIHVDDSYDDEPNWREQQRDNQAQIQLLELGTSVQEVRERMGPADVTEAFQADGRDYRILRYRTQHRHADGETTPDETTPLLFENGRLVGWGTIAVNRTLRERGFDEVVD